MDMKFVIVASFAQRSLKMLPVGQPLQDHLFQGPVVLPFAELRIHHPEELPVVLSQSPTQIFDV